MRVSIVFMAAGLLLGCRPPFNPPPSPETLSETGLYADIAAGTLADGVQSFQPRFTLWSDTAGKERWLQLPDGGTIDTSDMDGWVFPLGTKAWKEFTRDGVRVETRLLEKVGPGDWDGEWRMVAYQWDDAQTEAHAQPDGVEDASGTSHDVPDDQACEECHGGSADVLLGFSAIQLDHQLGGLDLATLTADDRLSDPPAGSFDLPGDAVAQEALGTLHANCGSCHGPRNDWLPLRLWLEADALGSVEETPTWTTAVNQESQVDQPLANTSATMIIAPGDSSSSLMTIRMERRGENGAMPPLASELVDDEGLAAVRAWIDGM